MLSHFLMSVICLDKTWCTTGVTISVGLSSCVSLSWHFRSWIYRHELSALRGGLNTALWTGRTSHPKANEANLPPPFTPVFFPRPFSSLHSVTPSFPFISFFLTSTILLSLYLEIQLRDLGSAVSSFSGVGAEPPTESNLVHFGLSTRHLLAMISMLFW